MNHSYQGMVGSWKSNFPEACQGPALQAGCLGAAVKLANSFLHTLLLLCFLLHLLLETSKNGSSPGFCLTPRGPVILGACGTAPPGKDAHEEGCGSETGELNADRACQDGRTSWGW